MTPSGLGGTVTLTVQREQSGTWLPAARLVCALGKNGTYADTFKPSRRGTYRIATTIAATATHAAAADRLEDVLGQVEFVTVWGGRLSR